MFIGVSATVSSFDSLADALAYARTARAAFAGSDWTVRIERPLYQGDRYRVIVG